MSQTYLEIRYLSKAAKLTKDIFAEISTKIKPGCAENEIAGNINAAIKKLGLSRSFRPIVASGSNAAKPHAKITKRKIRENDIVVIDFGVTYKGYRSDMTRTIIFGKPNPRLLKIYKVVSDAQTLAIRKIKPGLKIADFVKSIHGYMRKKGFGRYILHTLGHGVGKRIHQGPKLSEKNMKLLSANNVVTIEPGLYIKGIGGARIEDMVYIGQKGIRVLTK